jgi:hypothetical protein
MPALFACKSLTATRPSHALAVAKQMLRSPASLEAEWVDETEPFSELVGSPLSDGGPTVVFGVRRAPMYGAGVYGPSSFDQCRPPRSVVEAADVGHWAVATWATKPGSVAHLFSVIRRSQSPVHHISITGDSSVRHSATTVATG